LDKENRIYGFAPDVNGDSLQGTFSSSTGEIRSGNPKTFNDYGSNLTLILITRSPDHSNPPSILGNLPQEIP
jgi:hypothetical protein